MDRVEIYTYKFKLIFFLILNLIFLLLTVKMVLFPEELNYSFVYNNKETIRVIGIFSTLFLSISFFYLLKIVFQKKLGLIIDDTGINDNLSPYKIGLIKWDDIEDISIKNYHSQKLIIITVKNPENYIKRVRNFFLKNLMKKNLELYNSPITISPIILKYNIEDLHSLIVKYWKFYKS